MRRVFFFLLCACSTAQVKLEDTPKDTGSDSTTEPTNPTEPPPATAPIYANHGGALYTWDPVDGVEWIGDFTDPDGLALSGFADIAIDAEGALYGAISSALYRIDPETAACTYERSLPDSGTGLTFLPDGRLLVGGMSLVAVDLATGDSETLVATNEWATSGDMVAVPDGSIHWSVILPGTDGWVRVDPDLGSAELVGEVGAAQLWGVAYAEDTLYAFASDGGVLEVDGSTGIGTRIATESVGWYGATTNPVSW